VTRHLLCIAALVLLASAAVAPSARAAEPGLSVPASGIDWAAGTVTVAAEYPAGTNSIFFSLNGQPFATVTVPTPTLAGTISAGVPYHLTAAVQFGADFLDARGASLGQARLTLMPSMFRPSVPELKLADGSIVSPSYTFQAGSDRTVTAVEVTAGPEPLTQPAKLLSGAGGRIEVGGVRVPYGIESLRITASNGFGKSPRPSGARTVFSLGPLSALPKKRASYVLVDKRSMTLYDVRHNLVVNHYDIAIGTPSTPTPNGYFRLGGPQRAVGSWGVLRRPLYSFSRTKSWPSGFYIHGTDAPWDIGTWASHGCVRLYNWAIRRFSRTVPNGALVLIRK
jgi:hypothetical protein